MSKILDFIRATQNYQKPNTVLRISGTCSNSRKPATVLTKKDLSKNFETAMHDAGENPRIEICRKDKSGKVVPIVGYREVKIGDTIGIFID